MAMATTGFSPAQTQRASIGSSAVYLPIGNGGHLLRVVNAGNALVYVHTGTQPLEVSVLDYPILPGTAEIIQASASHDTIALISPAGGSEDVYITIGSA